MARRVRGEQPLPGATEQLLQARKTAGAVVARTFAEYLSLSVSVSKDGEWRVTILRMDPSTGQIVPEWLDSFVAEPGSDLSMVQVLRYWAGDEALERRQYRV